MSQDKRNKVILNFLYQMVFKCHAISPVRPTHIAQSKPVYLRSNSRLYNLIPTYKPYIGLYVQTDIPTDRNTTRQTRGALNLINEAAVRRIEISFGNFVTRVKVANCPQNNYIQLPTNFEL